LLSGFVSFMFSFILLLLTGTILNKLLRHQTVVKLKGRLGVSCQDFPATAINK